MSDMELVTRRENGGTELLRKLSQAAVSGPGMKAPTVVANKADSRIATAAEAHRVGK